MKQVFIYVSDHGFGHAARTIALVRKLHQKSNCKVFLKNLNSYKFLKQSLPDSKVIKTATDVGPIFNHITNSVDVKTTFDSISDMINKEKKWLEKKMNSLKKIHQILL